MEANPIGLEFLRSGADCDVELANVIKTWLGEKSVRRVDEI